MSRFPVYDNDIDDIIGVLNTRDFLLNAQLDEPKPLRELLRPAYLVPETVPADTLFSNMQKQKKHLAIVVDEYGGMSGIVTMEDLLEEIVGNIYDEFDPSEDAEIEKLGDNLWRVTGTVDLETLAEALEVDLPLDEEYDTLGGMVFSSFDSIPEDGARPKSPCTACIFRWKASWITAWKRPWSARWSRKRLMKASLTKRTQKKPTRPMKGTPNEAYPPPVLGF